MREALKRRSKCKTQATMEVPTSSPSTQETFLGENNAQFFPPPRPSPQARVEVPTSWTCKNLSQGLCLTRRTSPPPPTSPRNPKIKPNNTQENVNSINFRDCHKSRSKKRAAWPAPAKWISHLTIVLTIAIRIWRSERTWEIHPGNTLRSIPLYRTRWRMSSTHRNPFLFTWHETNAVEMLILPLGSAHLTRVVRVMTPRIPTQLWRKNVRPGRWAQPGTLITTLICSCPSSRVWVQGYNSNSDTVSRYLLPYSLIIGWSCRGTGATLSRLGGLLPSLRNRGLSSPDINIEW